MTDQIVPDDKDWTWVLQRPCPECGFDTSALDPSDVGDRIRDNASAWQRVLSSPDARNRPSPDRWSPLEYACHVRDVFDVYLERLDLMLTQDGPSYPNWDQDATAITDDYASQSPVAVAVALTQAAAALADRFDMVDGDQWQRTGFRSDGASFTIDTFARYFIHDPVHHLWDVRASEPRAGRRDETPAMEIRTARPEEFEALGRLTLDAYRTVGRMSPEYEAELVDVAHRAEHARVLVAVDDDGRPLGCCTLVLPGPNPLSEHRDPAAGSMRMLAVDPGARGRGVGEALTLDAIEQVRAAGATAMVLHSATNMTDAHRLYRRLGFVRDESLDWVPEPDVSLLGFRLDLSLSRRAPAAPPG